jgi:hypothetical protein
MGKTTKYTERKFLGKINGFDNPQEREFEHKHFKAYKRGHKTFTYGRDLKGIPIKYEVLQEVTHNSNNYYMQKGLQKLKQYE